MMYINQPTGSYTVNQRFQVEVRVAEGQTWNAAQATLALKNLVVDSVQAGDCGLTMLSVSQFVSPSFLGATLGTFVSSPCIAENLTVHGVQRGQAGITLSNAKVISNETYTDILTGTQNGLYTITKTTIQRALRK